MADELLGRRGSDAPLCAAESEAESGLGVQKRSLACMWLALLSNTRLMREVEKGPLASLLVSVATKTFGWRLRTH